MNLNIKGNSSNHVLQKKYSPNFMNFDCYINELTEKRTYISDFFPLDSDKIQLLFTKPHVCIKNHFQLFSKTNIAAQYICTFNINKLYGLSLDLICI